MMVTGPPLDKSLLVYAESGAASIELMYKKIALAASVGRAEIPLHIMIQIWTGKIPQMFGLVCVEQH